MTEIVQTFPLLSEPAVASYDYTDIADGTGVILFYGYEQANVADGTTYALNQNAFASNNPYWTRTSAGTDNYSFNLTAFNRPRIIAGTATVQCTAYRGNSGDGLTMTFTFQKVSEGSTTNFGESSIAFPSSGSAATKTLTVPVTLTTTHFKKNDNLRIYLTLAKTGSASDCKFYWDPLNGSGTAVNPQQFKIFVPFRLGL